MMRRKRLTELLPWLLPLRRWQRKTFFYIKQYFDKASYSFHLYESTLPYTVFETSMTLINPDTGQDIIYQENKVHNLKLAARTLNHLVIYPGEAFSFWRLVRHADKHIPYKDGLVVENGQLKTEAGGGLCMMSNLLYWMFLHSELTVIERKGHAKKEFPDPGTQVIGVDATVSEGWIDLQVKNETTQAYQIILDFDNQSLHGRVLANSLPDYQIAIVNGPIRYIKSEPDVIEEAPVIRHYTDKNTNQIVKEKLLYTNRCIIGYPLPQELFEHDDSDTLSSEVEEDESVLLYRSIIP